MKHLSVDQIIEYVSMTKMNDEELNLSATVNEHICKCEKCFELVQSFQLISDEFTELRLKGEFRKAVKQAEEKEFEMDR